MLDGQDTGKWFGKTFQLAPGTHSLQITVPDSKCCKPLADTVEVQPALPNDPAKVQMIVRKLEILPATVKLAGAPANAQYSCPSIGLVGYAGGTVTVKLPDALWTGKCQFTPPAQDAPRIRKGVTLRAGEDNTVPWPATGD
jgi:serine/threonine-protein kinase